MSHCSCTVASAINYGLHGPAQLFRTTAVRHIASQQTKRSDARFVGIAKTWRHTYQVSEEDVRCLVTAMDSSGDGTITLKEFASFLNLDDHEPLYQPLFDGRRRNVNIMQARKEARKQGRQGYNTANYGGETRRNSIENRLQRSTETSTCTSELDYCTATIDGLEAHNMDLFLRMKCPRLSEL